jgi:hypothetical protein
MYGLLPIEQYRQDVNDKEQREPPWAYHGQYGKLEK